MIDGIRGRRLSTNLHPRDRELTQKIVVGDHSKPLPIRPPQPPFRQPSEVAATDGQASSGPATNTPLPSASPQPATPRKRRSLKAWFASRTTKQKIIITAGAALVTAGLVIGSYFLFFSGSPPVAKPPAKKQAAQPTPAPTTVASNLTGLQVDPSFNERSVTAVMIENSTDARPQSGLNQAGIVFEAIAEGGITRFVALFQDTAPDYVGPVRSVRPYYIQWIMGFDAALAHAGGSPDGLALINQAGTKDLNHASDYFWRVNNRAAPHNLYTSIPKLHEYEGKKGYGKSNFTPLARKAEKPSTAPTARTIDFKVSSDNFNVRYAYDAPTNSYKRSEGGAVHTDEKSGAQLAPKVVVALVMPQGISGKYTTYAPVGSGQAYVFQDGVLSIGTWKKDSNNANLLLTDASGAPLALNPGQTWFTALGGTDRITYTP